MKKVIRVLGKGHCYSCVIVITYFDFFPWNYEKALRVATKIYNMHTIINQNK